MKRWFFIPLLFLLLGLAAGCRGNTGEPVSWQVVEVAGKAVQVKDGTKAWHKVTIKNTGGTKAEQVQLCFRMPGLVEYGDDVTAIYPGQNFTISDPSRLYKKADFIRYLYNYEGDGTIIIKWQENGVKKYKKIPYAGKYHPKEPEPDRPSKHVGEKTMGLYLSPHTEYLVQSAGPGISLYKTAVMENPKTIWNDTDPNYWGSSNIVWASDGQKFIFTSTSYPGDSWNNRLDTIWAADIHNHPARKIFAREGFQSAIWSPDSRYILIQFEARDIQRVHREATELILFDTQTAKKRLLISGRDKQHIVNPRWSPDSQRLIYNAILEDNRFILAVYDLKKGESAQITTTEIPYFPQFWSRDGKNVYYETGSYGCMDMGIHQLGVYNLDTCQDHRLTTEKLHGPSNCFVSISPDEKTLLFNNNGRTGSKPELLQINLESEAIQMVQAGSGTSQVLWTTDSRNYIYYVWKNNGYDGRGSIWQSNIDQPKPQELLKGSMQLQQIYKGKLYYIGESPAGLLKEYTLQTLDLSSGRLNTILRLPEYTAPQDKATVSQDFGFILRYGVRARNELNTLKGTFTKDLILAGNSTTRLKLSGSELQEIYAEMLAMNIVDYPDILREKSQQEVTPYLTYDLTIYYKGTSKQIYWDDQSLSKSPQAIQLRSLLNKIIRMVESKPEYKKMPAAEGGYM